MGNSVRRCRSGVLATLVVLVPLGSACAGPARYDENQRGFRFTYTYASLTEGAFGDQAIGAPQKATEEQDGKIRAIVLNVSDALSKATAGRAKILSLDLVQDAKKADVVISLTGKPGRGGWAIAGAIEGRPGQIGLYYNTLAEEWERDVVLTAVHEVCHYIFGLVDEYNFPRGCPEANPGGPGCLMDNYLSNGTRHGWYGRLCKDDHVSQPAQRKSCQEIVDAFFAARNVGAEPREQTPQNKVDNIAQATVAKLKAEAIARNKTKGEGKAFTAVSKLGSVAREFFTAQLKANDVTLDSSSVSKMIGTILQQASAVVTLDPPVRLASELVIDLIKRAAKDRAARLRAQNPKESADGRKSKILAELKKLAGPGGSAPLVTTALNAEETSFLEHVAMQAAAQVDDNDVNKKILDATMTHIKLSRAIARNVLDNAAEDGVPGIPSRLAELGEIDADLRLYLPGRTASSGFGLRRTIIVDPEPMDPAFDFVVSQAGIFRYADLRARYIGQFRKLVDRAKIELTTTDQQISNEREAAAYQQAWLDPDKRVWQFDERAKLMLNSAGQRALREAEFRATLAKLSREIRSNRYENVILLVPPGGLPGSMTALLESFRRELLVKADVRLDLVFVGTSSVPFELRDACASTGGTIATITDIDEIGALAQRLKNEQSTGAWVVAPQQDYIAGRFYDPAARMPGETRWIFFDPKMEQPKASAASTAFDAVQGQLADARAYLLGDEAKSDFVGSSAALEGVPGRVLKNLRLIFADPETKDGKSAVGLEHQLTRLKDRIVEFNKNPSGGSQAVSDLNEQLIRARTLSGDARANLSFMLDSLQGRLNPEYDEDRLFAEAYRRVNEEKISRSPQARREKRLKEVLESLEQVLRASYPPEAPPSATRSYIRLKMMEVRLRFADDFLAHVEKDLSDALYKPLFTRIDRRLQVAAYRQFQDGAPGFIKQVPGFPGRAPLPPSGLEKINADGVKVQDPSMIRLSRFYAENLKFDPKREPGEFELVLGLSRPLPGVDDEAIRLNDKSVLPELRLHDDNGMPVEAVPLALDQDVSSPTCLVWRFAPEYGIGWYTAALKLSDLTMRGLASSAVNYTFSVSSNRPNIRLTPALVQVPNDPELIPPPPNRGLARNMDRRIKIEVQVYGGTSVLGASVRGVLHKLNSGEGPILPLAQEFHDDGPAHGDQTPNDGVYTTIIPLDQIESGMEYRLIIQAESTALSRNIGPEDPNKNDAERRKLVKAAGDKTAVEAVVQPPVADVPETALQFQRATSIHVRVER